MDLASRTTLCIAVLCFGALGQSVQSVGQSPAIDRDISNQFDAQRADTERRVEITDLKGRVDSLFSLMVEREKQVALALTSSEAARIKSEDAQREVNIMQNEFRGTLKDQADTLAPKESVDQVIARVSALETQAAAIAGRSGGFGSASALVFAVLSLLLSVGMAIWAVRSKRAA